jgi:hypothetical protein
MGFDPDHGGWMHDDTHLRDADGWDAMPSFDSDAIWVSLVVEDGSFITQIHYAFGIFWGR